MNFRKSSERPLTPPLIFGNSCCGFFIRLYSLKNHTCGIFLKSPGYESIKNNDPCCQIQCLNFKFWGWLGPRLYTKTLYQQQQVSARHWPDSMLAARRPPHTSLRNNKTCCCKSPVWEVRTENIAGIPSPNLKNCNPASQVIGLMKWNCAATYEHPRPLEYREG